MTEGRADVEILGQRLSVRDAFDRGIGAEAAAQEARRRIRAEIRGASRARMVAVRVGDHGAIDRLPGVDVELAGFAIQPLRSRFD